MPERYLLYKGFESGFNNDLMSLELAVGMAWITKRTLVYYGTSGPDQDLIYCQGGRSDTIPESRKDIINNAVRPNILDLVDDLPVPCMKPSEFKSTINCKHLETTECGAHLHESAFSSQSHSEDSERRELLENFLEGRTLLTDPKTDIFHLGNVNLGYYSRCFFEPPHGFHAVMGSIRMKKSYDDLADRVSDSLGVFNAIHVRLTDFRSFQPRCEERYKADIINTLQSVFNPQEVLVICTDESENALFFNDILNLFPNHVFLDAFITKNHSDGFANLPFTDETTFGLICNLVLQRAKKFAGTPGSSYTAMIHRSRLRRMVTNLGNTNTVDGASEFKFISNGFDDIPIPFNSGIYLETKEGPFSWNRIQLPIPTGCKSWYREWPESVIPVI